MKRALIIIAAIALLAIGAGRPMLNLSTTLDDEMIAYAHHTNYSFAAIIDSVVRTHDDGRGYLKCKMISGTFNRSTEDSLNHHLTNYKRIRFLSIKKDSTFDLGISQAHDYSSGDTMRVNSTKDQITISRDGRIISERKISESTWYKVYFAFWLRD